MYPFCIRFSLLFLVTFFLVYVASNSIGWSLFAAISVGSSALDKQ